jgi:ubiquinone biosynthesis protein UbiJ
MSALLAATALKVLNHLLAQTPGGQEKLAAYAGRHARLAVGAVGVAFAIAPDGTLAGSADTVPAVTLRLPADALLRLPHQGEGVLREARIEGDAALAETLGQVLRSLRWDAAEDLSRMVGDVAAERMVGTAHSLLSASGDLANRFANAGSEYVADEAQMLIRPAASVAFASDVDTLRDDFSRLQKRIELLERRAQSKF